jgi:hypothetical protein
MSMGWFAENPTHGEAALKVAALTLTVAILWFGRKERLVAIVCALVFLLLAAMAIPSVIPARTVGQKHACIANLLEIQEGKQKWAKENNKPASETPTEKDLYGEKEGEGYIRHHYTCPRGGVYTIGTLGQEPTCSLADKRHKISEWGKER